MSRCESKVHAVVVGGCELIQDIPGLLCLPGSVLCPRQRVTSSAVLRHLTGVVDGLVKVTAVFSWIWRRFEGLDNLQEALNGVLSVAGTM